MKPKVYITKQIPEEVEEYIAKHCQVSKWDSQEAIPREVLLKEIREVEGLLTTGGRIDASLLEQAPQLKVVSNISVGYNNFDVEAMKQRNIIGTNTPYVLDETVADLVFALILTSARRMAELDKYVKEGRWQKGDEASLFGIDVHGSTLGIIGLGRIGKVIARRASLGFGMKVIYHNRSRNQEAEEEYDLQYAALEELLQESDFVLLMTPLTEQTRHLMGKKEFELMKETSIFINASRGGTVDEQALIEALQTGQIRSAGLDVFQEEPTDPNNPLLKMDHVVTVPHIGSATAKTRFNMAMLAAENLVNALQGKKPVHLIEELQ